MSDPKIIGSLAWMNWRANPVYDVENKQTNIVLTNDTGTKDLTSDQGNLVLTADWVKRLVRWI